MDRRTKYTKKIVSDTFLELLKEKDINKITVSELCQKADINRATFYRYYLDVYDLLEKIEQDFILELVNATDSKKINSVYTFTYDILKVFLHNKELVKLIFNTKNTISSVESILDIAYSKCESRWKNDLKAKITTEEIEFACIFMFNGALGIINYWIKNDFNGDIEEIAKNIETLGYFGTNKYIYKK